MNDSLKVESLASAKGGWTAGPEVAAGAARLTILPRRPRSADGQHGRQPLCGRRRGPGRAGCTFVAAERYPRGAPVAQAGAERRAETGRRDQAPQGGVREAVPTRRGGGRIHHEQAAQAARAAEERKGKARHVRMPCTPFPFYAASYSTELLVGGGWIVFCIRR